MKFHRVDLVFPEKGLFCIHGENEAGKSTVGNLIFFALSGKGSKGETAEQLINWEKNYMKVKLSFRHRGSKYQLLRQVDRDGSNFSKLARGKDVLAQGKAAILEALKVELGYDPIELQRSFLVTHRIVQDLVHSPSVEHLDYMLGLDKLSSLVEDADRSNKELDAKLDKAQRDEKRYRDDLRAVGFDPDEMEVLQRNIDALCRQAKQLGSTFEMAQNDTQALSRQQDQVKSLIQELPGQFNDGHLETLPRVLPKVIDHISILKVKEKSQDLLKKSSEKLEGVVNYMKCRTEFFTHYEERLDALKKEIGVVGEGQDLPPKGSLERNLLNFGNSLKRSKAMKVKLALGACLFGGMSFLFFALLMSFWSLVGLLKGSPLEEFFMKDEFAPYLNKIVEFLAPGEGMRFPVDHKPWVAFGVLVLVTLCCLLSYFRLKKNSSKFKASLESTEAELILKKEVYHGLLAVEIKDMKEVFRVLSEYQESELEILFKELKHSCSDVVEADYDLGAILSDVKEHLSEVSHHLGDSVREQQARCSGMEKDITALQDDRDIQTQKLDQISGKESRHQELEQAIEKALTDIEKIKRDRNVQAYKKELAEGALKSVRDRLRRDLTMVYKEMMPELTSERYASIRFNDEFSIEVFSDERGDFVPLHQLSSGTNDLFVLLFQMILLQGFMSSRKHDFHFLFLDEPLLAVDATRYQKLADVLPNMCDGLQQVFLCRPPQDEKGVMEISTSLGAKELISDLSLARDDRSFD
jgi:DNA repair exonuclease SbcCD ATPase subunit